MNLEDGSLSSHDAHLQKSGRTSQKTCCLRRIWKKRVDACQVREEQAGGKHSAAERLSWARRHVRVEGPRSCKSCRVPGAQARAVGDEAERVETRPRRTSCVTEGIWTLTWRHGESLKTLNSKSRWPDLNLKKIILLMITDFGVEGKAGGYTTFHAM